MILKIFRGMWFLSVLAVIANLLYVYASLPEQVVVQDEATGRVLFGREPLFYGMLMAILMVNVLVYIFAKFFPSDEDFRAWFHGQLITINIFFIVAMSLVQTYNSAEHFDYSRIALIIYSSIALVMLWAISWPMYSIFRKIFPKQAVL